MENKRKQELVSYLNNMSSEYQKAVDAAPELLNGVSEGWFLSLDKTSSKVAKGHVFVPVVGGFSAGKSTALNGLLERKILPEAVSAETAIPAELHFSTDEHLLALGVNGEWERHTLESLSELTNHAAEFQVVRLFVNCQALKQIEPLVLVDMPGFGSGLDQHNQAILRYLTSGVLYLYLVNSKDGTVNRQDIRRLEEIVDLGRSVRFFLSRCDLIAPNDLQDIRELVVDQLDLILDGSSVECIDQDTIQPIISALDNADLSRLFDGMYLNEVKSLYFDANANLCTAISALSKNSKEIEKQLDDAKTSVARVEAEKDQMLNEVKNAAVDEKANLIVSRVEKILQSSLSELAVTASAGQESLSRSVGDLVRSTLTVEIQKFVRSYSSDVVFKFSDTFKVNTDFLNTMKQDWLQDLAATLEFEAMNALSGISEVNTPQSDREGNVLANMLSGIAMRIPNPVLKVVLAVLPQFISSLFGNFQEKRKTVQFRQVLADQLIPGVIAQIRPQVLDSLNSIQLEMIKAVAEQFYQKVESEKKILDDLANSSDSVRESLREGLETLKSIRTNINQLTDQILNKG